MCITTLSISGSSYTFSGVFVYDFRCQCEGNDNTRVRCLCGLTVISLIHTNPMHLRSTRALAQTQRTAFSGKIIHSVFGTIYYSTQYTHAIGNYAVAQCILLSHSIPVLNLCRWYGPKTKGKSFRQFIVGLVLCVCVLKNIYINIHIDAIVKEYKS